MNLDVRLISPECGSAWDSALPSHASVFSRSAFARIAEGFLGVRAHLWWACAGGTSVSYVVWSRSIADLAVAEAGDGPWQDLSTPPFSGPFVGGTAEPEAIALLRRRFDEYCEEAGVVSEFAHLHPWGVDERFVNESDVSVDREIVYVDLSMAEDRLWDESFSYACRKNLKRNERDGVRVVQVSSEHDLARFHRIYSETMERNGALSHYRYPVEFFAAIKRELSDSARFNLAMLGDAVTAGTLYLRDGESVYSYLGGADPAFQNSRPTNAVVLDAIRWGQSVGARRLVLGGGYRPDDGIFRFKASFSPLRASFRVLRTVRRPGVFEALCRRWMSVSGAEIMPSSFPPYRAALPADLRPARVADKPAE